MRKIFTHYILGFLLGVVCSQVFYIFGPAKEHARINNYESLSIVSFPEVTCHYPQFLSASFDGKEIGHVLPTPEEHEMVFTFSNMNSEVAKLQYIDATRSISETPIVKVGEDDEKVVFVDGTGNNYISTHMLFKKTGVAVFTKSTSLLGIASGSLSIGTCFGR